MCADTRITSRPRKAGKQPRGFAKPAGGVPRLSKLCTRCQDIFRNQLDVAKRQDLEIGVDEYTLYGDGHAWGVPDCHLCFLRLRSLAPEGIDPEGIELLDRLTTRYRIEIGTEKGAFFALKFSYSLVPSSEELQDSSEDVMNSIFSLTPISDMDLTEGRYLLFPPARSGSRSISVNAENLSLRHYAAYDVETKDSVATYYRRETLTDRGLWGKYESMIQSNSGYEPGSSSTNSPSAWAIAKLWIEHCIDCHERCEVARATQRRPPTRLVYVGDGAGIRPHLVNGSDLPESTRYLTLSHRWGNQRTMVLQSDTKEILYRSIPPAALTPTFKDAVEATQHLGYHYIWIDSLCIEQDSTDDWNVESQRMGEYYSNSICNLAASKASDDGSGCFVDRNPLAAQPCLVRETWTNTSPQLTFYVHDSQDQFAYIFNGCELSHRGWVVQETLLAPRTLYFGYDQVLWDCLGHRACEAYPALWINQSFNNKVGRLPSDMYCYTTLPESRLSDCLHWETLIESYSNCSLTFPEKDKLVALSGIAKVFGNSADYLAGLWCDNLGVLLLWKPEEGTTRHECFVAPSWSWASMNGGVTFDGIIDDAELDQNARFSHVGSKYRRALWEKRRGLRDRLAKAHMLRVRSITTPFITLVSADMQPTGADATGRVMGGSIQLKGFPFLMEDVEGPHARKASKWMDLTWDDKCDEMKAKSSSNERSRCLLPVRIRTRVHLSGLILQRTARNNPGEYRRVGIFSVRRTYGDMVLESLAIVKKYLRRRPRPLEKGDFIGKTGNSKDGFGEYIISII